jgi:nucleoside-diphosphate-sugar epimerase
MRNETVLVTGAAGTVGAYLVRELALAGCRVIAHDRPGARLDVDPGVRLPDGASVEVRTGDLRELDACVDAVRGASAVIHVAATIDLSLPTADIMAINRDAVRYLYQAARAAGCRRFVFLSSGSIYKKVGSGPIPEDRELAPQTDYERSKAEAEHYLMSLPRGAGDTDVVVLRPSMIYGPRARFLGVKLATLPPMMALALEKIPRLRGGPVCNWIHAEDVARAAAFVLAEPRAAWQTYNVADETAVSLGEVLETITLAYGLPVGAEVPYPMGLLAIAGPRLAEVRPFVDAVSAGARKLWSLVVERHGLSPVVDAAIDRETYLYAAVEAVFDTSKLRALGFRCKWPSMREGYPSVLRWFQQERWLPTYVEGAQRAGAVGVRFAETMAGHWQPRADVHGAGGAERMFRFSVTAEAGDLRRLLADGTVRLDGILDAGGLAMSRPCRGTLVMDPFGSPRTLRYDVAFDGDDGKRYRFAGHKTLELMHPLRSMTTLPGAVLDAAGEEVGRCLLRFDLAGDLVSFLGSFALHTGAITATPVELPPAERTPRIAPAAALN